MFPGFKSSFDDGILLCKNYGRHGCTVTVEGGSTLSGGRMIGSSYGSVPIAVFNLYAYTSDNSSGPLVFFHFFAFSMPSVVPLFGVITLVMTPFSVHIIQDADKKLAFIDCKNSIVIGSKVVASIVLLMGNLSFITDLFTFHVVCYDCFTFLL